MIPLDPERIEKNARAATTEDLLERVTVYREGMEPEALDIIEAELRRRGVNWQEVADHDQRLRRDALMDDAGIALRCSFCNSHAVEIRWGWHWMWGRLPVLPMRLRYCREHLPADDGEGSS